MAVPGAELDVLVGGRDEAGALTVCTMHPFEPMEGAVPELGRITGARVVAVNPRGVGRSSPLSHPGDATLQRMADDLDAVRLALGIGPWVIWGMSGGSMIAQVYARRHPEGLAALVLDSAGPCFAETLRDEACVLSPRFPRWREPLAAAGLLQEAGGDDSAGDLAWAEVPGAGWVARHGSGPALLVAPGSPPEPMRRAMPSLLAFDARPWLGAVRVPTLVISGTNDQVAPPAQLRALHEAIPGSSLATFDGAGHVPLGERPDAVAAAVRGFLTSPWLEGAGE